MNIDPTTGQVIQHPPTTGLIGSEQALQGGLNTSIDALGQGFNTARQDLAPFANQGADAFTLQSALTGALGNERQATAFNNFQMDPGTQFLLDEGNRGIINNSAAIGGLGGGNVRRALTRFNQGTVNQTLQQRLQNLNQISGAGLNATTNQANIAQTGGRDVANVLNQTAQNVSQGRLQTGRDIADAVGNTTSALSNLINQQGAGVSDIIGQGGGNLASILQGLANNQATGQTDLARILANISVQQGTTAAALPSGAQFLDNSGRLTQIAQLAQGVGTAIKASDRRLKTNIRKIGVTLGGHNFYIWDWNAEGYRIAGDTPGRGVMSDEVAKKLPEAVILYNDGYYRVDYARIH